MQPNKGMTAVAREAGVKHKIKKTLEFREMLDVVGDNGINKLLVSRLVWFK